MPSRLASRGSGGVEAVAAGVEVFAAGVVCGAAGAGFGRMVKNRSSPIRTTAEHAPIMTIRLDIGVELE
jgi:hypothetical protein